MMIREGVAPVVGGMCLPTKQSGLISTFCFSDNSSVSFSTGHSIYKY